MSAFGLAPGTLTLHVELKFKRKEQRLIEPGYSRRWDCAADMKLIEPLEQNWGASALGPRNRLTIGAVAAAAFVVSKIRTW